MEINSESADIQTVWALLGDEINKFCRYNDTVRIISIKALAECHFSFRNSRCKAVISGNATTIEVPDPKAEIFGLLVGHLKVDHDDLQLFRVVFEDGTGCLPCINTTSNICPQPFGKTVVVIMWNHIAKSSPDQGCNHIELAYMLPLHADVTNIPETFQGTPPLTVDAACFLQYNRDMLETGVIDVIGRVKAISEPLRMKPTAVFLVELEDLAENECHSTINLLVRDSCLYHWSLCIRVQVVYVFSKLRPTTLNKGENSEEKVYLCLPESKLAYVKKSDLSCLKTIPVTELLKAKGIADYEKVNARWIKSQAILRNSMPRCQFTSYEGVVSSVDQYSDAVFDLDGRVRVYFSHLSSSSAVRFIRLGSRVSVCNAHMHTTSEAPTVRLLCCSYSCIKVAGFSTDLPPPRMMSFSASSSVVRRLVGEFGLSFGELLTVLDAKRSVNARFNFISHGARDELLCKIVAAARSNGLLCKRDRDLVAEFFNASHTACNMTQTPFVVPSVNDVLRHIERELVGNCRNSVNQDADLPACGWQSIVVSSDTLSPPWMLVGVVRVSNVTGMPQLVDQTGSINCVIAAEDSRVVRHQCSATVCGLAAEHLSDTHFVNRQTCPYLQISFVNKLYLIKRFQLVVEKYDSSNGSSSSVSSFLRTYIQFSMESALQLHAETFKSKRARYTATGVSQKSARTSPLVSSPHNLNSHAMEGMTVSAKSFELNEMPPTADAGCVECETNDAAVSRISKASDDDDSKIRGSDELCSCSVSRMFVIDYREPLTLRSRIPTQICLYFAASGWFIGPSRVVTRGCSVHSSEQRDSTKANAYPSFVPVTVIFRDSCSKWAPLLHPGCIYRFTKLHCTKPDAFGVVSGFPGKARSSANMRFLLSLDEDVELERLYESDVASSSSVLSDEDKDALDKVLGQVRQKLETSCCSALQPRPSLPSTVFGESAHPELVTITGVVVARSFCKAQCPKSPPTFQVDVIVDKFGIGLPVNVPVVLTVRDLVTSDQVDVYMDFSRIQYTSGLLVGAVVRLERLERKVTPKEKCYFRSLVISTCTVVRLAPDAVHKKDCVAEHESFPRIFLVDLWKKDPGDDTFVVSGHVSEVKKVFLRIDSTVAKRLTAHASFKFDDGTMSANVWIYGKQVAELLDLDCSQWSALEELVRPFNEIHVVVARSMLQANNGHFSPSDLQSNNVRYVESFVQELCESTLVKRSLDLVVRQRHTLSKDLSPVDCVDLRTRQLTASWQSTADQRLQLADSVSAVTLECVAIIRACRPKVCQS